MSGYRFEIETSAGPARGSLVGGGAQLLVRVRLFDGPGVVDSSTGAPAGQPDAFTDLRPRDARKLAFELLAAAQHADQQALKANHWEPQR
jgi:hypothetical protein